MTVLPEALDLEETTPSLPEVEAVSSLDVTADSLGEQAAGQGAEKERLAALRQFAILDTPPEPAFDRLVRLAADVFEMPMAAVSFIAEDRQWFKAQLGLAAVDVPRGQSLCSVAISREGVMVIPDASQEEPFRHYPVVSGPLQVRSYAGAPLVTPEGEKIGTFCVSGSEPREFTVKEQRLLAAFAEMVMAELKVRRATDDLSQMAMSDALTGLPNRVQFRQSLLQACARADLTGGKVVVGLLDLDRFKSINDTFGHAAGDVLLVGVARRLREATSTGDVVARLSGDEFVVLLTDVRSVQDIAVVTRNLEQRFHEPFLIEDREVFVHWSLGLSVYPDDSQELDVLLSQADAAMYRVKRAGGGSGRFQLEDGRSPLEVERLTALHRAAELGELRLYYQPVVYAGNRAVVGHEALLRWIRPSGLVPPLDFIPLAESSGLIVSIGRWVQRQAVEALRAGRMKRVSVNVSAVEIRQPDFVANLRSLLTESGVAPARLLLELTESCMLEPRFASVLEETYSMGIQTALDDFGNGYSSLTALSNLPIQVLKIDRSFTAHVADEGVTGRKALDVVRGIVSLARAYGLPTVAEGVETDAQAHLLYAAGCTYLQGYLFGRPKPLPD